MEADPSTIEYATIVYQYLELGRSGVDPGWHEDDFHAAELYLLSVIKGQHVDPSLGPPHGLGEEPTGQHALVSGWFPVSQTGDKPKPGMLGIPKADGGAQNAETVSVGNTARPPVNRRWLLDWTRCRVGVTWGRHNPKL